MAVLVIREEAGPGVIAEGAEVTNGLPSAARARALLLDLICGLSFTHSHDNMEMEPKIVVLCSRYPWRHIKVLFYKLFSHVKVTEMLPNVSRSKLFHISDLMFLV